MKRRGTTLLELAQQILHDYTITPNHLADRGGWAGVFGSEAPLVLEIGFGWDSFLIDEAAARPNCHFIGIEYDSERVKVFVRRSAARGLKNIRAINGNADHFLPRMFLPRSLQEVYVHFPDPWPKKRHQKNRLLDNAFLGSLLYQIQPDGHLVIGTDSEFYAKAIIHVLDQIRGTENQLHPDPWVDRLPGHRETRFEQLFRGQGKPIHYFSWRRLHLFDEIHGEAQERRRAQLPERMSEMPHVCFEGVIPAQRFADTFYPMTWQQNTLIFRIENVWKSPLQKGILLECVMVVEGHDSYFFLELQPKSTQTILRVSPIREVDRDAHLFAFVSKTAEHIARSYPDHPITRHNLGKYAAFQSNTASDSAFPD